MRNTARPILFHLHNKRGLYEGAIYNGAFPEESAIIPHLNLFVIQVIHKMILFIDHSCNFHNTFQVGAFFIFYIRVEKTRLERNITQLVNCRARSETQLDLYICTLLSVLLVENIMFLMEKLKG